MCPHLVTGLHVKWSNMQCTRVLLKSCFICDLHLCSLQLLQYVMIQMLTAANSGLWLGGYLRNYSFAVISKSIKNKTRDLVLGTATCDLGRGAGRLWQLPLPPGGDSHTHEGGYRLRGSWDLLPTEQCPMPSPANAHPLPFCHHIFFRAQ